MDSVGGALVNMSKEYAALDFFAQMMPEHPDLQVSGGGLLKYLSEVEKANTMSFNIFPGDKPGKLEDAMALLGKKGISYTYLKSRYNSELENYMESYQLHEKCLRDLKKKFSYSTIVSKPNLPDNKAAPKRSVIVIMACIGGFLFSCLYFIFIERLKKLSAEIVKK